MRLQLAQVWSTLVLKLLFLGYLRLLLHVNAAMCRTSADSKHQDK